MVPSVSPPASLTAWSVLRSALAHHSLFLIWPSADILEPSPHPDILCFVEDPTFGYEDFTRRGTQAPPTFRAQVRFPALVAFIASDLHASRGKWV